MAVATAAAVAVAAVPATAQLSYVESAAAVGIQYFHNPEPGVPTGAGYAWVDFDNDGDYDLYGAQGQGCNMLFLNDGVGGFLTVADAAGAGDCLGNTHGVSSADFDNDGDADLYVANNGHNTMFKNRLVEDGFLNFEDITIAAGMDDDGAGNSSSATWADYDNDGFVDLFLVQHMESMEPLVCFPDFVWHNNGDGTFTNVAEELDIADSGTPDLAGCGLAVTTSDFDNDGDQDLMIVNDFGGEATPNRLFRNDGEIEGEWTFTDVSASSGFDYEMFGMGIAIGDIDLDGDFDYYMADIGPNNLGRNNGDGTFTDVAAQAGVEAEDKEIYGERGLVSWGTFFGDLDNSGVEDLVVANGGAPQQLWPDMFGVEYVDTNPNYSYRNNTDGTFTENHENLGFLNVSYNRNATFVDFDDDGDLDVHFGNLEGMNHFYVADLGPTNWLKVHAEGTLGNRDAIGARVRVRTGERSQMREVDGGSSFMSLSMRTVHFGLGNVTELDQIITEFQGGLKFEDRHVPANQTVNMFEPLYTVTPSVEALTVNPGDTISVDFTVKNLSDETVTIDTWMDIRNVTGFERTVFGPAAITMAPGEEIVKPITVNIPASIGPGVRELIFHSGGFPSDVNHKAYVDVDVQ